MNLIAEANMVLWLGLAFAVCWYLSWFLLSRFVYPQSRFRAFDVLFVALGLGVISARVLGEIINSSQIATSFGEALFAPNTHFFYLLLWYMPLLSFLLITIQVEKVGSWLRSSLFALACGCLWILPFSVFQLVSSFYGQWDLDLKIYHLVQTLLVIAEMVLIYLVLTKRFKWVKYINTVLILAVHTVLFSLLIWRFSNYDMQSQLLATAVHLILFLLCLYPFGARERQPRTRDSNSPTAL